MRGPLFFHRLKRIEAVKFLPSWADTHKLTKACVCCYNNGNGWLGAICQGKPVLVLDMRYRNLDGVHEWNNELTYEAIANCLIDHHSLEKRWKSLCISHEVLLTVLTKF